MYKTILVPLDQSQRAEAILSHVEELARCNNARIVLVHVVEPIIMAYSYYGGQSEVDSILMDQMIRSAIKYLDAVCEDLRMRGFDAVTRVVDGSTVDAILKVADEEKADLIAMASHGRSGLARVIYGSIASGMLQRTKSPLLLIRSVESAHEAHPTAEKEMAHADKLA